MHNGQALYASNAGKLNGLAPEAYIQTQDNILDNGYFKINQQTEDEYTKVGYTVDRWSQNGDFLTTVFDDHITIEGLDTTVYRWLAQNFENPTDYAGKVFTFAVLCMAQSDAELRLVLSDYNADGSNKS